MISRRNALLCRSLGLLSPRCVKSVPAQCPQRRATSQVLGQQRRSLSTGEEELAAPFEVTEETQPRQEHKLEKCESWVHDLSGNRHGILHLNPAIFGLPPRVEVLISVVLRQLKYKLQDEPYGSEENNFINFDRFQDPLYQDRPYLKPWVRQGIAWNPSSSTAPTEFKYDSTSHLPIPHYNGTVPKKLREIGLRNLLSLKYRYNKLHVVDDLSSNDRYIESDEFRVMLDGSGLKSTLMITGNRITPHFKTETWKRKEPFPVPFPGAQRLWKTACNTQGCELREVEGLDVWSALLYDTLVLDISALHRIGDMINTQTFSTPNINLRKALQTTETNGSLGPAKERHKVVRVVNLDNL